MDTGDALIGDGLLGNSTQGEAVVAGMNLMGYDAAALGPKELSLGRQVLQQRLDESQFAWLSANATLAGTADLVVAPYTILDVAGRRLAVIGLTRLPDGPSPDFEVSDPVEAARRYVPQVAGQADTVLVLTNLPYREALALAEAVPGIDLLVAALPGQLPSAAVRTANGTIVVTAEQPVTKHTGRQIGRLAVHLDGDGTLRGETWSWVAMGAQFADDPQMQALLDSYRP